MRSFVRMGRHEMAEFLEQPFLRFLLLMIWADPTLELPPQFVRMMTNVTRRPTNRPPSYEAVIGLIDLLTAKMKLVYNEFGDISGPDTPEQRFECNTDTEQQYLFTKQEAKIIHTEWSRLQGNIFVDKLISINQNPLATHSIIENLIRQSRAMEERVFRTLRIAISGQATQHSIAPYLRVASQVFCRVARQQELVISLITHVSQQCSGLQSVEGMAFLDFQRDVFNTPQEGSGFSRQQILAMSYDRIPMWAPGLLGYFETAVVTDTEAFLGEVLFKHGTSLTLADSGEDSNVPIGKIIDTARRLGLRCLIYLRDNYVVRREGVATRLVAGLERVIRECGKFYNLKDSSEDEGAKEFIQLRNSKCDAGLTLPL
jgi:ubiquitin carboxyl-terminal hydrolase 34